MRKFKSLEAQKRAAEKQANAWNAQYPIGQAVVVQEDFKPKGAVTKTRSEAFVISCSASVLCEGIVGAYALTHVTPIEQP